MMGVVQQRPEFPFCLRRRIALTTSAIPLVDNDKIRAFQFLVEKLLETGAALIKVDIEFGIGPAEIVDGADRAHLRGPSGW